jgi:hypothetical protein
MLDKAGKGISLCIASLLPACSAVMFGYASDIRSRAREVSPRGRRPFGIRGLWTMHDPVFPWLRSSAACGSRCGLGQQDMRRASHEIFGKCRQPIVMAIGEPVFERNYSLPAYVSEFQAGPTHTRRSGAGLIRGCRRRVCRCAVIPPVCCWATARWGDASEPRRKQFTYPAPRGSCDHLVGALHGRFAVV